MATIMQLAKNAGFEATGLMGFFVLVSLTNRKPSIMEVAFALNIPEAACRRTDWGVTIDTRKVSE